MEYPALRIGAIVLGNGVDVISPEHFSYARDMDKAGPGIARAAVHHIDGLVAGIGFYGLIAFGVVPHVSGSRREDELLEAWVFAGGWIQVLVGVAGVHIDRGVILEYIIQHGYLSVLEPLALERVVEEGHVGTEEDAAVLADILQVFPEPLDVLVEDAAAGLDLSSYPERL